MIWSPLPILNLIRQAINIRTWNDIAFTVKRCFTFLIWDGEIPPPIPAVARNIILSLLIWYNAMQGCSQHKRSKTSNLYDLRGYCLTSSLAAVWDWLTCMYPRLESTQIINLKQQIRCVSASPGVVYASSALLCRNNGVICSWNADHRHRSDTCMHHCMCDLFSGYSSTITMTTGEIPKQGFLEIWDADFGEGSETSKTVDAVCFSCIVESKQWNG
jgi:hypothetical protein